MKRWERNALVLLVVAFLGVGALAAFTEPASGDVEALRREAAEAVADGDLETARTLYGRVAAERPEDPEIAERLLAVRSRLSRTNRARERVQFTAEAWLRSFPERDGLRRVLVDVARDLGRYHDALAHLDHLERNDDDPRFPLLRAECLEALGRPEDAIDVLTIGNAEHPEHLGIAIALANALGRAGRVDDAEAVFTALTVRRPRDVAVLRAHAEHALRFGELATADRVARRLVEASDEDGARALLATILLERYDRARRGDAWDEALVHHRAAADVVSGDSGDDGRLLLVRARLAAFVGDTDRAGRALQRLVANEPSDANRLAAFEASLAAGDREAAERLAGNLDDPLRESFARARLAMEAGDWAAAIEAAAESRRMAAGLDGWVERIELVLAECHARLGDPTATSLALHRALKANPRSASARRGLAAIAEDRGAIEQALAEYRSLPLDPVAIERIVTIVVRRNERRPEIARDWSETERLVRIAEAGATDAASARRLRAILDRGRKGNARTEPGEPRPRLPSWRPRHLVVAIDAAQNLGDDEGAERPRLGH